MFSNMTHEHEDRYTFEVASEFLSTVTMVFVDGEYKDTYWKVRDPEKDTAQAYNNWQRAARAEIEKLIPQVDAKRQEMEKYLAGE